MPSGMPGQARRMALVSTVPRVMGLSLIDLIQYPLARTATCQRSLKHSRGLHFACVRFSLPFITLLTLSISVTLFFIFVVTLASRSVAMGRHYIWREDIRELPWFGQAPGYPGVGYTSYSSQYGSRGYPGSYAQYPSTNYGGNVVHQQPGHSLVIQPGMNGGSSVVQQVPTVI
jgi:hypothetical protein